MGSLLLHSGGGWYDGQNIGPRKLPDISLTAQVLSSAQERHTHTDVQDESVAQEAALTAFIAIEIAHEGFQGIADGRTVARFWLGTVNPCDV